MTIRELLEADPCVVALDITIRKDKPVLEAAHQNMIEYQKPEVIGAAIDEEICRLDHCMPKPYSEDIDWEELE